MTFNEIFLNEFLENLAKLFGNNCEVVLHDFSNGLDHSIAKIINGHVTGRKVGDPITNTGLEALMDNASDGVYYNKTDYGQILKCASTLIKDEEGNVVGSVCINHDITDLMKAQKALDAISEFASFSEKTDNSTQYNKELYYSNVNEMVDYYLSAVEKRAGKQAAEMNKKERMEAIAFLDKKGVFQISKAGIRVCEFFGISRFTLYSDLNEIHEKCTEYRPDAQNG